MSTSLVEKEKKIYSKAYVEEIREKVKPLIEKIIKPNSEKFDKDAIFPRENLIALAKEGWNSVTFPERLGGLDYGYIGLSVAAEEIGRVDASTGLVYAMHVGAAQVINLFGTDDQKERWLLPVREGSITTFAVSEKASGGNVWYSFSQAEKNGDEYILNLEKSFATSGGQADFYIVQTRTAESDDPSDKSFFIVDGHQEGITAKPWKALGVRSNHSGSLKLENIKVHQRDLIQADKLELAHGHGALLGLNAVWLGVAQGALDAATAHLTKTTHQNNNKRLADYQVLRQKLAEVKVQIAAARVWQYDLARQADVLRAENKSLIPLDAEITELKVFVTELADFAARIAMDVAGGYGYIEGIFERLYRDARGGIPMAPSNNLARDLIGKGLLGLPLELYEEGK